MCNKTHVQNSFMTVVPSATPKWWETRSQHTCPWSAPPKGWLTMRKFRALKHTWSACLHTQCKSMGAFCPVPVPNWLRKGS